MIYIGMGIHSIYDGLKNWKSAIVESHKMSFEIFFEHSRYVSICRVKKKNWNTYILFIAKFVIFITHSIPPQCNYKTSSMESKDLVESLYASLHCGLKNRKKSEWKFTSDSCKKTNLRKKKLIFDLKFKEPKQQCNFYELPLHFSILAHHLVGWFITVYTAEKDGLYGYVLHC